MSIGIILVIAISVIFIIGGIYISHLSSKAYYGQENKDKDKNQS